jgi:hypothetical protein
MKKDEKEEEEEILEKRDVARSGKHSIERDRKRKERERVRRKVEKRCLGL